MYEKEKPAKNSAIFKRIFSQRVAAKAVNDAAKPKNGKSPRRTVRIPKTMENCAKKPAKRFEKGATSETFLKTNAETGRTARKATVLTQKDFKKYFITGFSSALKVFRRRFSKGGAKTKIAPQEKTDIKNPASQAAKGSKRSTETTAIPRFSAGFEPEKKILER